MCVVVIGGGITGLAAAWHLKQSGKEVLLLEKTPRLGGCILTEHYEGFIIEHGPDVFLARKPHAIDLCQELGIPVERTNGHNRGAYIRRGSKLYRLPEGLSGLVPTRLGPLLTSELMSLSGRLRVLLDLVIPPRRAVQDESVAAFFTRRLGKEAFTCLIEPVLSGISGGRADELSMKALFPKLWALEQQQGSILMGLSCIRRPVDDSGPLRSIPGGLNQLINALHKRLGAVVHCQRDVSHVSKQQQTWHVHVPNQAPIQAQAIILAVPAWQAASLLRDLDSELSAELAAIPHNSTVVANLGFKRAAISHPLNGHGYLVSQEDASPVAACTWSSSKLPGRAPADHVLLRVFLTGQAAARLSDEAIEAAALRELQSSLGVTGEPLFIRIRRYEHAMPQYVLGHSDRLQRINDRLKEHRALYIAGPMSGGIGIADCIRCGRSAASRAIDVVGQSE